MLCFSKLSRHKIAFPKYTYFVHSAHPSSSQNRNASANRLLLPVLSPPAHIHLVARVPLFRSVFHVKCILCAYCFFFQRFERAHDSSL